MLDSWSIRRYAASYANGNGFARRKLADYVVATGRPRWIRNPVEVFLKECAANQSKARVFVDRRPAWVR
ncbi:MAG TPA: hypothetical protein VKM94_14765, partial [Blastocatellia bacterium]|nr:hypothetical protein [Blastocatellia bacterium]